jgi:hypothetical protein
VLLLDDEPVDSYHEATPSKNAWQGDQFTFLPVNTVRGAALILALSFGAWVKRALGDIASTLDDISGLRDQLERHLGPIQDPSTTIRSVYGQYLYRLWLLDEKWTRGNFDRIFPVAGADVWLGDVAWSTYVGFNSGRDPVTEKRHLLLRPRLIAWHRAVGQGRPHSA